jgi:ClpA/ClpB-like protein
MKREAEQSIRPMHLLLGLLNEGEGLGAGVLRTLGFSFLPVHTASGPADASQICSFCGRSGEEAARLFPAEVGIAERSTPSPSIFICDHCVKRFSTILGTA